MNQKGFSLLEMLITVVIASVGLLAIAGMQHSAIKGNKFGKEMTEATTLARDKIEYFRSLSFTHSDLTNTNTGNDQSLVSASNYDHQESGIDANANSGGKYTRTWNISDNTPLPGTKTVMLVVTWPGHRINCPYIKSDL